jgi:hypothetical protein
MRRLTGQVGVADEVHGFRYFDERDLIGFVDGTESPGGRAGLRAAIVTSDQDPDFAGGSYVIVQKYVHDIPAWNALSVAEQERVIGRTKLDAIEMPDDIKPAHSHVALNALTGPDSGRRRSSGEHAVRPGEHRGVRHATRARATLSITDRCSRTCSGARPQHRPDPRLLSTALIGCNFSPGRTPSTTAWPLECRRLLNAIWRDA